MQIAGLQKTTLVDYPGKVACTIFTPGCNFRCGYCHNPDLVQPRQDLPLIPESEFFEWLATRKKWLDGVCVTGGEPCLQKDLPAFAKRVKDAGFLLKLDTNGSNPKMLKEMLDAGSVDFVAMDVKAPLEKYAKVTNAKIDAEAIAESARLIMKKAPDYEFRTTVAPSWYSKEDAVAIGKWLEGAKAYYLQQFVPINAFDAAFKAERVFSPGELNDLKAALEPLFEKVEIRF